MPIPDESSIPWFHEVMRLHRNGLTPKVTPNEYMPSRPMLAEFWGPRAAAGYTFHDHGMAEYEAYVRELYGRVLQLPWPVSGLLPFHFARGLVVEAMGIEVNWCEYAYIVTHPPQSNRGVPRILRQYAGLIMPLPPLTLVRPRTKLQVS